MLLTIDVGNSNTVLGVFRGEELIANWRLTTEHAQTVDEYGVLTRSLLSLANLDQKAIAGVMAGQDSVARDVWQFKSENYPMSSRRLYQRTSDGWATLSEVLHDPC